MLRASFASLVLSIALIPSAMAVGTPFGMATGTTGGGSAAAATPTSLAQLTSWLSDSTARTIVLTSMFDYTSSEGTTSGKVCAPWTCSPNPQLAIDQNEWCENYEPNASLTTATYNKAGLTPLAVGSNKTILGKGASAGIKGKGLKITGQQNIIIQNLSIRDINEQFVWGGDALQIDGGKYIWVDHNNFQNVGRQFVVTGYGAVTHTTFSNNIFNGQSTHSATCNSCHYWTAYFTGAGDQITFALNYLYMTSGRGPKIGGMSGYYQDVHMYNNYWVNTLGHALDPSVGSKALLEGNYFNKVTSPVISDDGEFFFPTTAAEGASCSGTVGRACVANTLLSSGSVSGSSTGAISGFGNSYTKDVTVLSAQDAATYVQANSGVGKVN